MFVECGENVAVLQVHSSNTFEQLCINLASEKLQKFINHHIFQVEEVILTIVQHTHLLLHNDIITTVVLILFVENTFEGGGGFGNG